MVGGLAWMTTKTRSFVSFFNYVTTVVSCRKVPGVQPSLRELWVEVWILEAASLSHHFQGVPTCRCGMLGSKACVFRTIAEVRHALWRKRWKLETTAKYCNFGAFLMMMTPVG